MKTKKESNLFAVISFIGIIFLLIYVLNNGINIKKDSVIVTYYDANGKIIQSSEVQLSMLNKDSSQASVSIPSQYATNYIRKVLPSAPSNAVTLGLNFTTTNTGNLNATANIKNAKFVATTNGSIPYTIYNPRGFSQTEYLFDPYDNTCMRTSLIGHGANTSATYYMGETFATTYVNTVKIVGGFTIEDFSMGSGIYISNITLQYYQASTWKDLQVICTNNLMNGFCSGTGTYNLLKSVDGIRVMMKLYSSDKYDLVLNLCNLNAN
jgi:hypothetical protein